MEARNADVAPRKFVGQRQRHPKLRVALSVGLRLQCRRTVTQNLFQPEAFVECECDSGQEDLRASAVLGCHTQPIFQSAEHDLVSLSFSELHSYVTKLAVAPFVVLQRLVLLLPARGEVAFPIVFQRFPKQSASQPRSPCSEAIPGSDSSTLALRCNR